MAILTSTGAVNLTTSTNWSPAQIPATGDDLVIGAHTLTLDADMTLNSITLNNASARFAISGTSRSVTATNGFILAANLSAMLITAAIPTGTSLTLTGTWSGAFALNGIANSTGGNLTLQAVAGAGGVLFADSTSPVRIITTNWNVGTLTTVGRFDLPSCTNASYWMSFYGGTYNHTNTGTSRLGNRSTSTTFNGIFVFAVSGTPSVVWSGDFDVHGSVPSFGTFYNSGSATFSLSGRQCRSGFGGMVYSPSGSPTIDLLSPCVSKDRARTVYMAGGVLRYRSQSVSVASDERIVIFVDSTVCDFTALAVTNEGRFSYFESSTGYAVVDAQTVITNTTPQAQACSISANGSLDAKIITYPSPAPTLPSVQNVAAGTVYGYAAAPLTGTGVIADPANLAAAMGTALESISAAALKRWVTVNTGETSATSGSVAALSGGGGSSGLTTDQWTALRAILGVPASGTTPDDPTAGILDTIRDLASSTDGKLTAPRLTKIDNLLGSGTYSTLTAAQVEAALLNDADGQALLDAISAKVQTLFDGGADVPISTLVSLIAAQITTDHGSGSYVRNTEPDNAGISSAKAAAESADAKITAGRLTRIDALPTATAGTAGGLALHGATGGGAGDASQTTLLDVQDTVDELAVALAGAVAVEPTGRITNGGRIIAYIGDDFRVRSETELTVPVSDPAGGLYTLLSTIGADNLQFGASLPGRAPGLITGTIADLSQSGSGASQLCNITIEISNCGTGLKPSEDFEWQIQSTQAHSSENDTLIRVEGMLSLRRNVVA